MLKLLAFQLTIFLGIQNGLRICAAANDELLELSCIDDRQCMQFKYPEVNVSCVDGYCRCLKLRSSKITKCQPKNVIMNNIIGGPCPCMIAASECHLEKNTCYCEEGSVPSKDRRRCIEESRILNRSCEFDSQCNRKTLFSKCDQTCICQEGFIEYKGQCRAILGDYSACSNDTMCIGYYDKHARCIESQNECICEEKFVTAPNKTACLPAANYNETCVRSEQCQLKLGTGGVCSKKICGCDSQHVPRFKTRWRCAPIKFFGDYCVNDDDCYQYQHSKENQRMECSFGECTCKADYYSINNRDCTDGNTGANLIANLASVLILSVFSICYY